jgi:hypothetical protein
VKATLAGRPIWMILLAAVGASLLVVIIATFWMKPNDSFAYWLAASRLMDGLPIYVAGEDAFEPYAFHYIPAVAQVLAPFTLVVPDVIYVVVYRILMILALWFIVGRTMLALLAAIAFIPVAVELGFENVHVFMAVGIVLGLGRWPWLFAIGALVKISPGLGLVYLVVQRRWKDALVASAIGLVIAIVSFALDPALWEQWLAAISGRAGVTGNSLLPVPYVVRAGAGLALAIAGGLIGRRGGEMLLVLAITIANPNLALNGWAVLIAAVPVWMAGPAGIAGQREKGRHPAPISPEAPVAAATIEPEPVLSLR